MKQEVAAQQPAQPGGAGDPAQADASRQAGATNQDTLRRAGANAQPARPGAAQIPAAGAPTADPSQPNGDGSQLTDAQVLDPEVLKRVFGEPPAEPSGPLPTGLGAPGKGGQSVEETLRSELATLRLHGDAYLVGTNKLLVDFRDKKAVKLAIGHHGAISVQVLPKGITPKDGKLVASASASGKGGKNAGTGGQGLESVRGATPPGPQ